MMKIFGFIFKTILRFATMIGVIVLILAVVGLKGMYQLWSEDDDFKPLPDEFTLTYTMKGTMPTVPEKPSILSSVLGQGDNVYDMLLALDRAKTDDRVQDVAFVIHDGDYSLTQLQTLRDAIIDFRTSGKKAAIYSNAFGDFSNGTAEYWFASAFDEINVQPTAHLSLNGIYIEQPYAKEVLDKLGVQPQIIKRKDYKTAPETYLRDGMSIESQETLIAIAEGMMKVVVGDIAKARGLSVAQVARTIHDSPLNADQARVAGLIDNVEHYDVYQDRYKDHHVSIVRYAGEDAADNDDEIAEVDNTSTVTPKTVAYIAVEGMILNENTQSKASSSAFVMPENIVEAERIADRINEVADDDNIGVIVVYINSPGGSPTASELIRRSIVNAKGNGKYVIAVMGDLAASGGYWITTHADEIIASNLTITGSIGVYGGKVNLEGLWDKIGINWDAVKIGQNAGMWSLNHPYDEQEQARLSAMMDDVYNAFVERVSEGRLLPETKVEEIAQGRAWIGSDALARGLVDTTGDFKTALEHAASAASAKSWVAMDIVNIQPETDPLDEIMTMFGVSTAVPSFRLPKALMPSLIPQAVVTAPALEIQF